MLPIGVGFFGDFVHYIVFVEETDTIREVAQKAADLVVPYRIRPREAPLQVKYEGRTLPDEMTVEQAGIQFMHFIEVSYAG